MLKQPWLVLIAAAAFMMTGCPGDDGGTPVVSSGGAVVYLADQDTVGVFELFLATSGTKLNPPLPHGRTVQSFALTPDSTAVVYIADQDQDEVFELYRVSLSSPGVSTKLNGPLVLCGPAVCGDVIEFAITPDNSAVVYIADQTIDGVSELYRTVLATTANSKLNPPFSAGQNIDAFVILPNSTGVIYRANQNTAGVKELYRVLFATAPTTDRLITSPPLIAGQNVGTFTPTPDSANVVYIANRPVALNLFIVPAGGGGADIQLNGVSPPNPNGNVTSFAVTPDGLSVVYRADQDFDEVFELYRTVIAAAPTNTKLNVSLSFPKNVTFFGVIPDGSGVVYVADQTTVNVFELFRTLFSGGNSQVNPPFLGTEDVADFVLLPNSTGVVYKADQNTDGVNEIYRAVFGFPGATRLNPPLLIGQNVSTYTASPDSASAIYRANQDTPAIIELYRVPFSSPGTSTKLNTPLVAGQNVTDFSVK